MNKHSTESPKTSKASQGNNVGRSKELAVHWNPMLFRKRFIYTIYGILFVLFTGTLIAFLFFSRELRILRRNIGSYHRFVQTTCTHPESHFASLPEEFSHVPFGESTGVVVGSKTIEIRGDLTPWNASILKKETGGYHLFFRYDVLEEELKSDFSSHIGYVELDNDFHQTEKEFVTINTQSQFSEDPRVFQANQKTYLVYNDIDRDYSLRNRTMCMREIDLHDLTTRDPVFLNLNLQLTEKNWSPFVYEGSSNSPEIYFEYSHLAPRKLLKFSSDLSFLKSFGECKSGYWPSLWGSIRGGTPAQKIDDQYLSFFHSSFQDKRGIRWYCMGAYTFESSPPFRITGISHYPILFNGIYKTPHMNTGDPLKRVIFPCGFVHEKRDEGDLIHVSCGENDSGIIILTLNKGKLLKSLKKIKLRT
jgi:predicted GH43/DUF377 family glycosyl hydrolase